MDADAEAAPASSVPSAARFHHRRQGNVCIVDAGNRAHGQPVTVQERLDEIGLGFYQLIVLIGVGGALLSESLEMGAVAPLHAAFARAYNLDHGQRTALPAAVFLGSGVGLAVAGPLCDWKGRKSALVFSLVTIVGVMFANALLPENFMDVAFLLSLRFLSGLAGAIQVPAGLVLAVESCPSWARPRLVLAVQLLGSMGYLLEAIGMKIFMPHFGEAEDDHWQAFCLLIGLCALVVLPFTLLVYESPSFLAVAKQDEAENVMCEEVLDGIASYNGQPFLERALRTAKPTSRMRRGQSNKSLMEVAESFLQLVSSHWHLLLLLCIIDSSRGWYIAGSSYLWKDLFIEADSSLHWCSAANLNLICAFSPIVGLIITERLLFIGVRRIAFVSTIVAAFSVSFLVFDQVRLQPVSLLTCVLFAKLIYAPLNCCIALIKAETFPTEIRVSAFCLISVASKITTAMAPTLIEAWRASDKASSWPHDRLLAYITGLMGAILCCGILTLAVPGKGGDGVQPLDDFFEEKRVPLLSSYGSFGNIWSLAPPDPDDEDASSIGFRVPRSQTSPNLMHA